MIPVNNKIVAMNKYLFVKIIAGLTAGKLVINIMMLLNLRFILCQLTESLRFMALLPVALQFFDQLCKECCQFRFCFGRCL